MRLQGLLSYRGNTLFSYLKYNCIYQNKIHKQKEILKIRAAVLAHAQTLLTLI